ncbi:MAG: ASCH domain-containing protein [Phycisphaerales bacterium]
MIHVAVLLRQYLELIASGKKSVECRLTQQARAPYEQIEPGDRIYFKQSSGPYRLTAIADHVLFESELTPSRIREVKRDYNDLIQGEADFWKAKKSSNYLSLIWLRDVEHIDTGPGIRPLQGLAWYVLPSATSDEEAGVTDTASPASAHADGPARLSFAVAITEGNIRNRSLYVTSVIDHFPAWTMGGNNRNESGRPITLMLRDGPTFQTDIVESRRLFRSRKHWGNWFDQMEAQPGDWVVFTPLDAATYFVGFRKGG